VALSTTRRPDWDLEWVWDLYTVDVETSAWRKLTESDGVARMARWSRDGTLLTFFHNHDATTSSTADYHLMAVPADGGERPRCLSHAFDRGAVQGMVPDRMGQSPWEWTQGRWLWIANLGGRRVVANDPDGHTEPVLADVATLTLAPDGRTGAALGLFHDRPAEVCRVDLETQTVTPVTDLNPWLRERRPVPKPYPVVLPTEDGPVESWVWEPSPPRPHPALIFFHGGPHGAVGPYFPFLYQIVPVTHGFVVACPNFRGSGGYGMAFANLCRENWGPKEGADGAALIRHLLDTGVARAGQIGLYGGSYGGFMTNWMVTRYPEVAQAAVTMSTVSNLTTLAYGIDLGSRSRRTWAGPLGRFPSTTTIIPRSCMPIGFRRRSSFCMEARIGPARPLRRSNCSWRSAGKRNPSCGCSIRVRRMATRCGVDCPLSST
jgi:hypothetical protein